MLVAAVREPAYYQFIPLSSVLMNRNVDARGGVEPAVECFDANFAAGAVPLETTSASSSRCLATGVRLGLSLHQAEVPDVGAQ